MLRMYPFYSILTMLAVVAAETQPGGWYVTEAKAHPDFATCGDVCLGDSCNVNAMNNVNSPEKMSLAVQRVKNDPTLECLVFRTQSPVIGIPVSLPIITEKTCVYLPDNTFSSCDKGITGAKRLCCCGTDADCALVDTPDTMPPPTPAQGTTPAPGTTPPPALEITPPPSLAPEPQATPPPVSTLPPIPTSKPPPISTPPATAPPDLCLQEGLDVQTCMSSDQQCFENFSRETEDDIDIDYWNPELYFCDDVAGRGNQYLYCVNMFYWDCELCAQVILRYHQCLAQGSWEIDEDVCISANPSPTPPDDGDVTIEDVCPENLENRCQAECQAAASTCSRDCASNLERVLYNAIFSLGLSDTLFCPPVQEGVCEFLKEKPQCAGCSEVLLVAVSCWEQVDCSIEACAGTREAYPKNDDTPSSSSMTIAMDIPMIALLCWCTTIFIVGF